MDFRAQVAEEKKRLTQSKRDAEKRVNALETELNALRAEMAGIDGELTAIEAYEAKAAPPPPKRRQARKPAAAAPAKRRRRRRRGSRREEIVSVIASFGAAGAGRSDIIQTLNIKGDKSAEQSVSNALAALKKSGAVAHEDGKYIAQAADAPAAPPEAREGMAEAAAEASAPEAPRRRRRRRSGRREAILSFIAAAGADGVGRGDIIGHLDIKGDKSAEQSVSNALAAMKKAGEVAHGDGRYSAAS